MKFDLKMYVVGREIGPNRKFSQNLILAFEKTHADDKKSNAIEKNPYFFKDIHKCIPLLLNVLTYISILDVCMSHGMPEWLVLTQFKITIEIGI